MSPTATSCGVARPVIAATWAAVRSGYAAFGTELCATPPVMASSYAACLLGPMSHRTRSIGVPAGRVPLLQRPVGLPRLPAAVRRDHRAAVGAARRDPALAPAG